MKQDLKESYVVEEKIMETDDVFTLKLSRDAIPNYIPGQFITVYVPELGVTEGKAYSISSAPSEKTLNITVKSMGDFSRHLCALNPGDHVTASAPYGFFFSESLTSTLVLVAAGIGIAPFRSMILDSMERNPKRRVSLFYSSRTTHDIVFADMFNRLRSAQAFDITHFITREKQIPQPMVQGRMKAHNILSGVRDASDLEFLICGSISFVRDLWRDLRDAGISEEALYTEAFFSH